MRKLARRVFLCGMLTVMLWCGCVISGGRPLMQNIMHLPVGANSDSETCQNGKSKLLGTISDRLQQDVEKIMDREAAKAYMQEIVPVIQKTADSLGLDVCQGEISGFINHHIRYTVVKILVYLENIFFAG